jgi:hypothetical protein
MKKIIVLLFLIFGIVFTNSIPSYAGVPFNNLEGVGGVAFNPLAYTAGNKIQPTEPNNIHHKFSLDDVFTSKPQIGTWYVNLKQSKIDWSTVGIAQTFFNRLEVSYGYELVSTSFQNIQKHNVGAKLLLLEENFNDWSFAPAVSIGAVAKNTNFDTPSGIDNTGIDYYLVATKMIKSLPKPVLISGGLLSTKGRVLGVLGFDDERDEVLFGNIDVLPLKNVAVGVEYRQGAQFSDFKNADYWDAHVAWFVNNNFSLAIAYVLTGNRTGSPAVGLGDGVVLSAQYAF